MCRGKQLDIKDVPKYVVQSYYNSWELGMVESFSPIRFTPDYHKEVRKIWTDYAKSLGYKSYQVTLCQRKQGQLLHMSYNELAKYCNTVLGLERFKPDYSRRVLQ